MARRWANHVRHGAQFAADLGNRYLQIRYEDLHSRPDETLDGVLRFLGVRANAEVIAHCLDAASFKRLSGGREQGTEDGSSFFRKGIVGDWRETLTVDQIRRFIDRAGSELLSAGYDVG